MKEIFEFISQVGKLKKEKRRGWQIHGIKDSETTASHIFQLSMLVWMIAEKREDIDSERAIKMALLHDVCEVYSPDLTSYDAAGIDPNKDFTKENLKNLKPVIGRPTTAQRVKMEKIKKELEDEAIEKLIKDLPKKQKKELNEIWNEHVKNITPESKLVRQSDRIINLLQGMEYWKSGINSIEFNLWIRRAKEVIDDPDLINFLEEIEDSL